MTIEQSLRAISNYPLPKMFVESILIESNLDGADDYSLNVAQSKEYKKLVVKVCMFLASAPNINENGFSVTIDNNSRNLFISKAQRLQKEIGEEDAQSLSGVEYGYKGEDF